MKTLSPVVWFEGMHLGPHHFQSQNRYFQDSIHFATSSLWADNYGLIGGELSAEALANGQAQLLHARGIFPDGLPFDIPAADGGPEPRDLSSVFPLNQNKAIILLAIPPAQGNPSTRFVRQDRALRDETTGSDERLVPLGRKDFQLLLETEDISGFVCMPLAHIIRSGAGTFALDPSYIPPCLDVSASARLLSLLRRLIEALESRAGSIALTPGEQPGKTPRDLVRFWFLHTLNSALAPLKHIYSARRGHPRELYLELARLAGALCTFALESHPRSLPLYDHDHLDSCFASLDEHIRRHLGIILPENCLTIPLAPGAEYFYGGPVSDARCLGASTWILAVRGGGAEHEVITRVPVLIKLCSEQFVPELVKRALPGLALTHMPAPPPTVPVRADTQYFSVNRTGPCWEHIRKTRQVGLYVPGDLPEPYLELLVVID